MQQGVSGDSTHTCLEAYQNKRLGWSGNTPSVNQQKSVCNKHTVQQRQGDGFASVSDFNESQPRELISAGGGTTFVAPVSPPKKTLRQNVCSWGAVVWVLGRNQTVLHLSLSPLMFCPCTPSRCTRSPLASAQPLVPMSFPGTQGLRNYVSAPKPCDSCSDIFSFKDVDSGLLGEGHVCWVSTELRPPRLSGLSCFGRHVCAAHFKAF